MFANVCSKAAPLKNIEELNRALLESMPCIASVINAKTKKIVFCNEAAAKAGLVTGETCHFGWRQRASPCPWCLAGDTLSSREEHSREIEVQGTAWKIHWIPVTKDLFLHFFYDITKQRKMEAKLSQLSYYDSLTRLPNRSMFQILLNNEIRTAQSNKVFFALIVINLDKFKTVNDTLGYDTGAKLLKAVGVRLKGCIRECDSIARIAGDEFGLLIPQIGNSHEFVREVNKRILGAFKKPFKVESHKLFVSLSLGAAVYPKDGISTEILMKNTDIAMHETKRHGGNRYSFYKSDMGKRALEEMLLKNLLHEALGKGEFSLVYQPKIDLKTKKITGLEALIRWNNPKIGEISPAQFIPIAEDSGLIVELGDWVLSNACKQNKYWQNNGAKKVSVSVNISAKQFYQQNLDKRIMEVLKETELDPRWLEIEITESSIMEEPSKAVEMLWALKDLGIQISLDDFGTGYSSLSNLKLLPISTVKIDQSFVSDITNNTVDRSIASAIINMAHAIGLDVVAEGVETKAQSQILQDLNCDKVQGNLYGRPLPFSEIKELMTRSAASNGA